MESGSEYNNYKGFFSLVLLALIDADYRFLWVDLGLSGSLLDAQIFKLREKFEDDTTLGLPAPEPLGREDQICTISCWARRCLCPDVTKPYSRRNSPEKTEY